jgi:hypothetical protein
MQNDNQREFFDLTERMKPLCTRTLRRQVLEYIKYTERLPITQEFTPSATEQEFYDEFSDYLKRSNIPSRSLMSIILWKLLASSTFAISGTLEHIINKNNVFDDGMSLADYETEQLDLLHVDEINELKSYLALAEKIKTNAKGEALLTALKTGFTKLKSLKAPQKAVIFTESRRTQAYLAELLGKTKYTFVQYHGGLTPKKQEETLTAFRKDVQIMIATESAAEGMNLQFCSMVINYDLPWNPQRIEQRIGRCHRYGQKHDVVVINFLNRENLADKRVYELLCDKFQLFEGVFGASDGILGNIDSLDFEKRIADIYSQCRTTKEIEDSFNALRESLAPQIDVEMSKVNQKLLENFDEEVIERLKINHRDNTHFLAKFEDMLWNVTRHKLSRYAEFDEETRYFRVVKNPYYNSKYGYKRHMGEYFLSKTAPIAVRYRLKGSLANTILFDCMYNSWRSGSVIFDRQETAALRTLAGKSGHLTLYNMEMHYPKRRENHLVFAGFCEDGGSEIQLTHKQIQRMFDFSGERDPDYDYQEGAAVSDKLKLLYETEQARLLAEIAAANERWFEQESVKLTKWANDRKLKAERQLRTFDKKIEQINTELRGRAGKSLARRIELEEQLEMLDGKKKSLHMRIFEEQSKVDEELEVLLEQTKAKLVHRVENRHIFSIKWRLL